MQAKSTKIERACEACSATFQVRSPRMREGRGRFCSKRCATTHRNRARGASFERPCEQCGTSFVVYPYQVRQGHGRFCRKSCFDEAQRAASRAAQIERSCEGCGSAFSVRPHRVRSGGGRFCDATCHRRAQARAQNKRVGRICDHCGGSFTAKASQVACGKALFCSRWCAARAVAAREPEHSWDTLDLAYLAAMIDGEGWIGIVKHREGRPTPYLRYRLGLGVTNTSAPLMEWLTATFGGRVYGAAKPSGRTVYQWVARSLTIMPILRAVRPFMKVKGQHADIAFAFDPGSFSSPYKGVRLPALEVDRREECWQKMGRLNSSGGKSRKGPGGNRHGTIVADE